MIQLNANGRLPDSLYDMVIAAPKGTEISVKILALIEFMETIDDPDVRVWAQRARAHVTTYTRLTKTGKAYLLMSEMVDVLQTITRQLQWIAPSGCYLSEWQGMYVYMPE